MGSGDGLTQGAEPARERKFDVAKQRINNSFSVLDSAIDGVNDMFTPVLEPEDPAVVGEPGSKVSSSQFDTFVDDVNARIEIAVERLKRICARSSV